MKLWRCLAALLLLTGCVNVSFQVGGKKKTDKAKAKSATPAVGLDSALAPAVNSFGFDLYRRLAAKPGNLIFSPLSISTVLASLTPGAADSTRAELLRVLHLHAPPSYRALMDTLGAHARAGGAAWEMANRAWVQQGMSLLPAFVSATREGFGYEVGEADFIRSAEPSRVAINQWVEQKTQSHIKDLFPAGSINPGVRLVLANAIYFKGHWSSAFDKKQTAQVLFHLNDRQTATVPMMLQSHRLAVCHVPGARILELPYQGEQFSMLVLLPDKVDGLDALEKAISAESLQVWTARLHEDEVIARIPRFTSDQHFTLNQPLIELGMPSAFDGARADFSGIDGRRDFFVGIVVHGAFVEVNEEGTEAAAATGATMTLSAVRVGEIFQADHPFLFLIRDRETGCILFMGRVVDPRG